MTEAERQLSRDRAARDAALNALQDRLDTLRGSVEEEGLGARVKHDAVDRVRETADEALEVAQESRWVIGATVALILAWLCRQPLLAGAKSLADRLQPREPRLSWGRLRDWTFRKAKL